MGKMTQLWRQVYFSLADIIPKNYILGVKHDGNKNSAAQTSLRIEISSILNLNCE